MNDVEYTVPPQPNAPKSAGGAPQPPKQPNKVVAWIKSNVATTVAGSIMAVIVVVIAVVLITGQKVSLFGLQLNPLFQQANCPAPDTWYGEFNMTYQQAVDAGLIPDTCGGGSGGGTINDNQLVVNGTFANGTVNTPYSQVFTVSTGKATPGICTWSVASINPKPDFAAQFVTTDGGPGTTATFTSTPTLAGTYNVSIKVVCSNGEEVTVTLPWVVSDVSTSLDIKGDFTSASEIASWYSAPLETINANSMVCSFKLVSVTPEIPGAYIDDLSNIIGIPKEGPETKMVFRGNPQNPADYKVKISVTCNPPAGLGLSKTAEKDFSFTVKDTVGQLPGDTGIDLKANFQDGKVNEPYVTYVDSINPNGNTLYYCRLAAKKITPAMSGATIETSYGMNSEAHGKFTVTPKAVGDYKVTVHAICEDNNPGEYRNVPAIVFDRDFTWKVTDGGGTTSKPLDISASFPAGKGGETFTTNVSTVNAMGRNCTISLVSVEPQVTNPQIIKINELVKTEETVAMFSATPQTPGTYTVKIQASCDPKVGDGKSESVEKTYKWSVSGLAGTPVFDISGSFPNGQTNKAYSTTLSTLNANGAACSFSIKSLKPDVPGASLSRVENIAATQETSVQFNATPTAAVNHAVMIAVNCPSINGKPALTAEKEFRWIVTEGIIVPPSSELSLKATFPDGKAKQAYSENIQTVNGGTNCTIGLVSVTPTIAGAKITTSTNVQGSGQANGLFEATPQTAGTYQVIASATCPPTVGDGKTRYVEKSFTWKVNAATTGGGSGGGGSGGGSGSVNICSQQKAQLTPIYRYWSRTQGDHFYTTNANEKPNSNVYVYEGISGYVFKTQVAGSVPIYRSYKADIAAHYYSTVNDATNYGYSNEGILGYALPTSDSGSVPWYRLHIGYPTSDYLETISTKEKGEAIAKGYMDEGVVANICASNV